MASSDTAGDQQTLRYNGMSCGQSRCHPYPEPSVISQFCPASSPAPFVRRRLGDLHEAVALKDWPRVLRGVAVNQLLALPQRRTGADGGEGTVDTLPPPLRPGGSAPDACERGAGHRKQPPGADHVAAGFGNPALDGRVGGHLVEQYFGARARAEDIVLHRYHATYVAILGDLPQRDSVGQR